MALLTEVKDCMYVICTPITTIVAVIVLICVNCWYDRKKRKDDQEREDRHREIDREEARQKADTEKIAAVLSKKYDAVVNIFHNFKKNVDKLKAKNITTDGEGKNFTEFDVLLYMCHPENMERFDNTDQHGLHGTSSHAGDVNYATIPRRGSGYGIREVKSDAEEIMKLFIEFRIQLSSIHDKACPEDIKSEFSTKIIDMGKTIYPFVSTYRQKVIKKVLKYFGYTDTTPRTEDASAIPDTTTTPTYLPCCFPCCPTRNIISRCCVRQNAHGPETRNLLPINATPEPNEQANEGLIPYPGHQVIESAIPYIKFFKYENSKMICNLTCTISHIQNLELFVEGGKIEEARKVELSQKIKTLWQQCYGSDLAGDLVHLIRMVKFKLSNDSTFSQNRLLHNFVEYVKSIVNSAARLNKDLIIRNCERALEDMEMHMTHLHGAQKHLKGDINTQVLLQRHAEELSKFMMSKLRR
jgi:hypothetical protein